MSNIFNIIKPKNKQTRNDINSRLQNFYGRETPNSRDSVVNYTDQNKELINGLSNNNNTHNLDKKTFKNDINTRLNTISGDELFFKRLPLNNNIRDYNVTIDTNKDEFNNRLMNYNSLANNINPKPEEENKIFQMGFHQNFKEDTNKRLEELSPLACNVGFPINKPKKNLDFGQNLEPEGTYSHNQYGSFKPEINQNENTNDINRLDELQYKRNLPADTTQHFYFSNKE